MLSVWISVYYINMHISKSLRWATELYTIIIILIHTKTSYRELKRDWEPSELMLQD